MYFVNVRENYEFAKELNMDLAFKPVVYLNDQNESEPSIVRVPYEYRLDPFGMKQFLIDNEIVEDDSNSLKEYLFKEYQKKKQLTNQ